MRRINPAEIIFAVARALAGDRPGEATTRKVANSRGLGPNVSPGASVPASMRRARRRRKGERK